METKKIRVAVRFDGSVDVEVPADMPEKIAGRFAKNLVYDVVNKGFEDNHDKRIIVEDNLDLLRPDYGQQVPDGIIKIAPVSGSWSAKL